MIGSFADKRTANVFNGVREGSFPALLVKRARSRTDRINYAANINDPRTPPGNRLEWLREDRDGQHSLRIPRGGRICLVWRDGDAFEVELNNRYD